MCHSPLIHAIVQATALPPAHQHVAMPYGELLPYTILHSRCGDALVHAIYLCSEIILFTLFALQFQGSSG
eukprot:1935165-Amphidinium_carterae.2